MATTKVLLQRSSTSEIPECLCGQPGCFGHERACECAEVGCMYHAGKIGKIYFPGFTSREARNACTDIILFAHRQPKEVLEPNAPARRWWIHETPETLIS